MSNRKISMEAIMKKRVEKKEEKEKAVGAKAEHVPEPGKWLFVKRNNVILIMLCFVVEKKYFVCEVHIRND